MQSPLPVVPTGAGRVSTFLHYPPGVYFILGSEFCERFSFYGMRAILTMYMVDEYAVTHAQAKLVYHLFVGVAYLTPVLGSVLADDYLGRFRVILYVSVAYVLGHVMLTVAGVPLLVLQVRQVLDVCGLFVIAVATGGIKPCVSAFAADQFKPHQTIEREQFFSFFYFAINAGALLSVVMTPVLKQVPCFGADSCYALAFGVPGALMIIALLLFVVGARYYTRLPPNESCMLWRSVCCVAYAIRTHCTGTSHGRDTGTGAKGSWLDCAAPKYTEQLIDGVRSLLSICVLFCPVVVFWALFDQQGSTWVLQASAMDTRVFGVTVAPDQMSACNAVFILLLVPLLEALIYPAIDLCGLRLTPLRKMSCGCLIAAGSFMVAAVLQTYVDMSMPVQPQTGLARMSFINGASQPIIINQNTTKYHVQPWQMHNPVDSHPTINYLTQASNQTGQCSGSTDSANLFVLHDSQSSDTDYECSHIAFPLQKSGGTRLRLLLVHVQNESAVAVQAHDRAGNIIQVHKCPHTDNTMRSTGLVHVQCLQIHSGSFQFRLSLNGKPLTEYLQAVPGGLTLLVFDAQHQQRLMHELVPHNQISVLYQVPQLFLITLAEVLISVTGLEFSYSQAAGHMKSVLQAVWLLTVSCGNLLAGGIGGSAAFDQASHELAFYAVLMLIVSVLFVCLSIRYKYVQHNPTPAVSAPLVTPETEKLNTQL